MNTIAKTSIDVSSLRKTSLIAGALYLLTFVSIPTLGLYLPIHDPNFVLSKGPDTGIIIGGLLEIVVGLGCIATAIALYPVLKQQHEGLALGLVAARTLEAATIFVGVAFILANVSLRQSGAGTEAMAASHALTYLYDRMFLLGQSFIPAINDLLLGILFYRSRLVPRFLSWIGIAGAPVLVSGYLAVMFGLIDRQSPLAGLSAVLVALFEFSLGIWLVVKGFNSPPVITAPVKNLFELSAKGGL